MFRFTIRFDILCLVAVQLVAVALGYGWYLECLNLRDMRVKAGNNMRAYLQEVAKNNDLRNQIERLQTKREEP